MKNYARFALMIISTISFAVCAQTLNAQVSEPSLSADDVKQIRELIAERDYQKRRADALQTDVDRWRKSSEDWKSLYEREKLRADGVQESRISALEKANADLFKANTIYRLQAEDDRKRLAEQTFQIRKLKSQRKWFFATGFGAGFGAGAYTGYRAARFSF